MLRSKSDLGKKKKKEIPLRNHPTKRGKVDRLTRSWSAVEVMGEPTFQGESRDTSGVRFCGRRYFSYFHHSCTWEKKETPQSPETTHAIDCSDPQAFFTFNEESSKNRKDKLSR